VEGLNIIRDLNKAIYQVVVRLTDERENLGPPWDTSRMEVITTSQPQVLALVQLVHSGNYDGLTVVPPFPGNAHDFELGLRQC